ncbi:GyrI-like domain-containing protein [Paenibacillus uliginis]|uniref:GyrI-like domain-containing protein n=1 Tax=Paenibacillus uliginis TaxID=683737 RepID=UPI001AD7F7ED|nr:GyrI-like domain-containing protein [Paenibacillus uliginis]
MAKVHIPRLWDELANWKSEIGAFLSSDNRVGVSRSRHRIYHYIAEVEVVSPTQIPDSMVHLALPVREYAVYHHAGETSRAEIDKTFGSRGNVDARGWHL